MTDPKATFTQKAAEVKSALQTMADAVQQSQSAGPASTESVISQWKAKGVLTAENESEVRAKLPTVLNNSGQQPMNVQPMIDMITAMEDIVASLGTSGFSLSEVETKPASAAATGTPGQFYIEGVVAVWLCLRTNFWVRLIQG